MVDTVPVTQADRDAVQAFHRAMFYRVYQDLKSGTPTLGEDMGDAGTLVQAFARHRLASASPNDDLRAALEGVVAELEEIYRAVADTKSDATRRIETEPCLVAARAALKENRRG